ncbi:hypothetical protein GF371_03100 [Candidatus Woesearchaeota archaeon]|nr:hypothetical protein [Candidatus Woesearchaeota archaeon]
MTRATKTGILAVVCLVIFIFLGMNASADCEKTVVYSGLCGPDGSLDVYDVNGTLLRSSPAGNFSGCYQGIYSIEIGSGGAGCVVEPLDILDFRINNANVANPQWDGIDYTVNLNIGSWQPPPPPPPPPDDGGGGGVIGRRGGGGGGRGRRGRATTVFIPEITRNITELCSNGIRDFGEEGIDCGGYCPDSCETCFDGIQNQGEEGIDCGGPCPECVKPVIEVPKVKKKPSVLWLWILILIVLGGLVGVLIYELKQHKEIFGMFKKKPTVLGPPKPGKPRKPVSFTVASPVAKPIKGAPVSKEQINKLISDAYVNLEKNNIPKVHELIDQISEMYKRLDPAKKPEIYKRYMDLYNKVKTRV